MTAGNGNRAEGSGITIYIIKTTFKPHFMLYYIRRRRIYRGVCMDTLASTFGAVVLICLGLGLVAAVICVFLFNNFNWWDKL